MVAKPSNSEPGAAGPALLRKLYGNAVIAAHLFRQRKTPFLPSDQLAALRDRRLRRIVRYAAKTVPHYRDWFAASGVEPREIRGVADLERLPVLDRDEVRAHPDRFVSESRAAKGSVAFKTSGSTGTPIEIRHDRRSLLANVAFGERERQPVIRASGGSFRPSEIYVGYETSTFKKVQAFYQQNARFPVQPARNFVSLLVPIEEIAQKMNDERPDVLVGYGGWLSLFFRTVAAQGIDLHRPKLVMYMGEALPHGAREQIEGSFGVPLLSRYNAVESFKIGFTCEERTGFHLHEDLCHVRIVDADGRSVPQGEQGEVALTNLVNRATVLINYPLGDLASRSAADCPCGRTLPLLSELEGRAEDVIALADGRFVHPRSVWEVLKDDSSLLSYQLTQHEPTRFTLTLGALDETSFGAARDRALPQLQGLLGGEASIEVQPGTGADREGRRKFRAVVSHCGPGSGQAR